MKLALWLIQNIIIETDQIDANLWNDERAG
jgi:hypothetical protein